MFNGAILRSGSFLQLLIYSPESNRPEPKPSAGILYVKDLPPQTNNVSLYDIFRPFGPMNICKILVEQGHELKGTALLLYFKSEDAAHAEQTMVNHTHTHTHMCIYLFSSNPKNTLYLYLISAPAQVDFTNLYIKNLDLDVSSTDLFTNFRKFGHIVSARVMKDKNGELEKSKGFGFVSFLNPGDAQRAMQEMNNKYIMSKPIVVAFHEPKKTRTDRMGGRGGGGGGGGGFGKPPNTPKLATLSLPTTSKTALNGLTLRRRDSVESVSSAMTVSTSTIQRVKMARAVSKCGESRHVDDIVDLLLTLKIKERTLCLFNKDFLRGRIEEAKSALEVFLEEDEVVTPVEQDDHFPTTINTTLLGDLSLQPRGSRAIPIIAPPTKHQQTSQPDSRESLERDQKQKVKALLDSIEGTSGIVTKQLVGERLFPLVKAIGVRRAPKITIRLLDTLSAEELANSMYDKEKLKVKVDAVVASLNASQQY
ncbi:hypothetical protein J3Q64DRAFT_1636589 [Phycomyces blakesleeanus]|uniref:Polyadenylate tail-binding protein n=1 Tax=Phycomyces blakesleeanus TaxID=4837 RepID=A0ABR3B5N5_PHYBL